LSLSITFSAFDGIPLGNLIFFFVGKGCARWGYWEGPKSIPPIGWRETMKGVGANSKGGIITSFANVRFLLHSNHN
jgi:hypothetical protein